MTTQLLDGTGSTWNRTETARTIAAGNWIAHLNVTTGAGSGTQEIRIRVRRRDSAGEIIATLVDQVLAVTLDTTALYSTTATDPGAVTFTAGDVLTLEANDETGNASKTALWLVGGANESRLVHPAEAAGSDGASAGAATVSGVGAATAVTLGESFGEAIVTAPGAALAASAGAAAGVATVSGIGASMAAGTGEAAGAATSTANIIAIASSAAAVAGVATVSGDGAGFFAAVAAASAAAAASASAASAHAAVASAAGQATVSGQSDAEAPPSGPGRRRRGKLDLRLNLGL